MPFPAENRPDLTATVLSPGDLDTPTEKLLPAGTCARLLPYVAFDPARRPAVLVHAARGTPRDLRPLADRLHAYGRQVHLFLWSARRDAIADDARSLARCLLALRAGAYPSGTPLDIVGHGLGGALARAALAELAEPGSLPGAPGFGRSPRAGFGLVRLRTIDTPWETAAGDRRLAPRTALRVVHALFSAAGWLGAIDLVSASCSLQRLYGRRLEAVDVRNYSTRELGGGDGVRALPDLGDDELVELTRFVLDAAPPRSPRARRMARALARDARYPALQARLRGRLERERLSAAQRARALVEAYDHVMPRFAGTHAGVTAGAERRTDLVDVLVAELAGAVA